MNVSGMPCVFEYIYDINIVIGSSFIIKDLLLWYSYMLFDLPC